MSKGYYAQVLVIVVLAAVLLLAPTILSRYLVHIGVVIAIHAIAVLGLGILGGFAGQVSLGQAAFYGIGAYVSALLAVKLGVPFWFRVVAAALVAGLIGLLVGIPTMRVTGLYLVMTTIGVNEIARLVMLNWADVTNGPQGVLRIPKPSIGTFEFGTPQSYFYLAILFLLLFVVVTVLVTRSRLGLYFRALGDSEIAANMVGVQTIKYKTLAFVLSAVWAGVAGALYAHYIGYIHPDNFTLDLSILFLTMSIFGGGQSVLGMLVATALLTGSAEYLRDIGEYRMVAYGLLLLLGMIYLPEGIGPYLTRIPAWLRGRLEARQAKVLVES